MLAHVSCLVQYPFWCNLRSVASIVAYYVLYCGVCVQCGCGCVLQDLLVMKAFFFPLMAVASLESALICSCTWK